MLALAIGSPWSWVHSSVSIVLAMHSGGPQFGFPAPT